MQVQVQVQVLLCWDDPRDAWRVHNGGECSTGKGRYLLWRMLDWSSMQIQIAGGGGGGSP